MNRLATVPDARWAAVSSRDESADGTFVYAVKTTGVYCRPSCPSRRALRRNVDYYLTTRDAEAAGFRPCRRCRPNEPEAASGNRHAALVAAACRRIRESESEPSLQALADAAGMSRFHFQRVFKAATGMTPKVYARSHRTRRLRIALKKGASVTDAIYRAGFNASSSVYSGSNEMLGMSPGTYRRGGAGVSMRFAVARCWLGQVLVAATDRGICAILFGDSGKQLAADLRMQFPNAEIRSAEGSFAQLVEQVIASLAEPTQTFQLPLDVLGTAFQQRVWQALRKIPAGSTATYTEVAAVVGNPRAVRAVARACASNTLAVAIPCHRVVRSDGALSGYRWGPRRKRALLDREK